MVLILVRITINSNWGQSCPQLEVKCQQRLNVGNKCYNNKTWSEALPNYWKDKDILTSDSHVFSHILFVLFLQYKSRLTCIISIMLVVKKESRCWYRGWKPWLFVALADRSPQESFSFLFIEKRHEKGEIWITKTKINWFDVYHHLNRPFPSITVLSCHAPRHKIPYTCRSRQWKKKKKRKKKRTFWISLCTCKNSTRKLSSILEESMNSYQ